MIFAGLKRAAYILGFKVFAAALFPLFFNSFALYSQEITDSWESDDLDSLFEDSQDSVGTESSPSVSSSSNPVFQNITFNGSVNAVLGFIEQFTPEADGTPYASFSSILGFTARPSSALCVRGSLFAKFPEMKADIKTLYFDYILFDKAYITAGRTGTEWGNSFIFDTNILDDSLLDVTDSSILDTQDDDEDFNKDFFGIATVPLGKGELQALAQYYYAEGEDLSKKNVSYAGYIEYPVGWFSAKAFAKVWPSSTDSLQYSTPPAVGLELTGDVFGYHINLWGKAHAEVPEKDKIVSGSYTWKCDDVAYAKFVGGIARLWETGNAPEKIGFSLEFQSVYDNTGILEDEDGNPSYDSEISNSIALAASWRHIRGGRFSQNIQWFHDVEDECGSVIPSLSVSGLPHATVTVLAPIFYGEQSTTYNSIKIISTKEKPAVLLGLVFSIAADF